jgi:hypothetical protein
VGTGVNIRQERDWSCFRLCVRTSSCNPKRRHGAASGIICLMSGVSTAFLPSPCSGPLGPQTRRTVSMLGSAEGALRGKVPTHNPAGSRCCYRVLAVQRRYARQRHVALELAPGTPSVVHPCRCWTATSRFRSWRFTSAAAAVVSSCSPDHHCGGQVRNVGKH